MFAARYLIRMRHTVNVMPFYACAVNTEAKGMTVVATQKKNAADNKYCRNQ